MIPPRLDEQTHTANRQTSGIISIAHPPAWTLTRECNIISDPFKKSSHLLNSSCIENQEPAKPRIRIDRSPPNMAGPSALCQRPSKRGSLLNQCEHTVYKGVRMYILHVGEKIYCAHAMTSIAPFCSAFFPLSTRQKKTSNNERKMSLRRDHIPLTKGHAGATSCSTEISKNLQLIS